MKRAGNLYEQICNPDNLRLAWLKAKKGKEGKADVFRYGKHLGENLNMLRNQLLTGEPEIGNYHFFTICEPKERLICAASFPERVLHHAIMNVCHPIFGKFQIYHSYAAYCSFCVWRLIIQIIIFCHIAPQKYIFVVQYYKTI